MLSAPIGCACSKQISLVIPYNRRIELLLGLSGCLERKTKDQSRLKDVHDWAKYLKTILQRFPQQRF